MCLYDTTPDLQGGDFWMRPAKYKQSVFGCFLYVCVCVYFWHKVGAFKGGGGGLVAVGRTFIVPFLSQ